MRESELERFIRAGGDVHQDNEETPDRATVAREELGEAFLVAATATRHGDDRVLVDALRHISAAAEALAVAIDSTRDQTPPQET